MSTAKPAKPADTAAATTATAALPVEAATPPSVKKQAAKRVPVKKPVAAETPKAPKAPDTKLVVKKPVTKTPLSKAFAISKPAKPAKPAKTAQSEKAVNTATTAKTVKLEKPKKPKLVRDSFTIPKAEYVVLEALKQRATVLNRAVKKSELLRAGIKALAAMHDAGFLATLAHVPAIKTGRPASEK